MSRFSEHVHSAFCEANELAKHRADIDKLARLRSDPHVDRALNEISRLSGAAREANDPTCRTV